ncbi:DEAD-domain-containing protein [Piedraia hortae CBS 480.64]|uniref:DEAD-domain-containing protein n=1 Tax=Piedraia hortae CBS 480.64 TaxID=1314780 RepID=A0A6A7CB42_9PEZI|nr:DEAD-domain-containing protein [Piedraia hortae CBS 480.64]
MANPPASATIPPPANKRKRKRKTEDTGGEDDDARNASKCVENVPVSVSTSIPTKEHDGGKKPRRKGAAKIPWSTALTKLEQVHKALNLIYTFCCTRKHFVTTFDAIKSAVEANIKRELLIEDVAKVKALVPHAIRFEYVDDAILEMALVDGKGLRNNRNVPEAAEMPSGNVNGEVLLFEFIDGDLKRQVQHPKTGEPTKATRKLREESLKLPVYSQAQMMKLIEKRNAKFTSAVNEWLNDCESKGEDAAQKLEDEYTVHLPVQSRSKSVTAAAVTGRQTLPELIPTERKSIAEIVQELKDSEWYTGQIVPGGYRVFSPQEAVYGELEFALSQNLVNTLYNSCNIVQFYSHQAQAINAVHNGKSVIISTSTSSGKSLIYQLPVLYALEQDRQTRAIYIFPTKALAQDQRRSLKALLHGLTGLEDVMCETFDGDTAKECRNLIREEARIIFTNPDMLHLTILPQEERWRHYLQRLKYVVVDELHVYNGLFGAHMALIMRRLRRICAAVGNSTVQFISCSATVANPLEHMQTIFGIEDVTLVDIDGSPSGGKEFLCWNTPYKDPRDPSSGRGDVFAETARLFCQLILRGVRVIAFCRIRKICEVLTTAVKAELDKLDHVEVMNRVMAYRGGYTPQDRRQIEKDMFEGKLVGIIGTNALELGVDIGTLDAVISVGFPYTISNLRQQSGRAGRRNKDSLSVLIGDSFPTDQHYMQNPDEIFTKPNCKLQVDLTNMLVLEGHIQCAAYEMPIRPIEDASYFGSQLAEVCSDRLRKDDMGFYHTGQQFMPQPSRNVAIRDTEDDHFAIIDVTNGKNCVLEELEASRAFFTIYEGGIFLHQGHKYLVQEMSIERKLAKVHYTRVDWTTQQRDFTDIDPIETEAIRGLRGSKSKSFFGTIRIVQTVFGYFKQDAKRRILDAVEVDNPPITLYSKGVWVDVPKIAMDILISRGINLAGSIHAAEHAVLSLMPNFVISLPGDVRTECKVAQKEFAKRQSSRKRPARLTFYDAKGGAQGSGIAAKAFDHMDRLLKQACDRIEHCHCLQGCLECCCSERCKERNEVMCKAGAGVILNVLLGKEVDIEQLPHGDNVLQETTETIVLAQEVAPRPGTNVVVVDPV